MECPKCGYKRIKEDTLCPSDECPYCGVIYSKVKGNSSKFVNNVNQSKISKIVGNGNTDNSLTPEERQKIYEEEKLRIETREAIESEKKIEEEKINKQVQFGCLGLVILVIFVSYLLSLCSDHDPRGSICQNTRRMYSDRMNKCLSKNDPSECGAAQLLKKDYPECFY